MVPLATNADVIVHEATNENAHEQKARENGHSTPGIYVVTLQSDVCLVVLSLSLSLSLSHTHTAMAAAFCKQVCGHQLILTHFSQRYKSQGAELKPGEEGVEKLLSEATEAVGDSEIAVHLAEDFRTFTIPAKK